MFWKIAFSLLIRKNWVLPLVIITLSSLFLFEQCANLAVKSEGDLWILGKRIAVEDLIKVQRVPEVASAEVREMGVMIKAVKRANIEALKTKLEKHLGKKVLRDLPTRIPYGTLTSIGLVVILTLYYFFWQGWDAYVTLKMVGVSPTTIIAIMALQSSLLGLTGWGIAICLVGGWALAWTAIPLVILTLGTGIYAGIRVYG